LPRQCFGPPARLGLGSLCQGLGRRFGETRQFFNNESRGHDRGRHGCLGGLEARAELCQGVWRVMVHGHRDDVQGVTQAIQPARFQDRPIEEVAQAGAQGQ
jgi:hypothetical protein